ncbi:hypothetical protein AQ490_12295 [Wenjunlia vitaminophila]|uniref:Putative T7SS secretion signal domain-containing protein n=1 Tax=Wenjunlia vitaminophila TaxID=76728 RepID=A0A0T6LKL7_WENVI|nr:hypothetical protein [Wenjunlia vitaminophila]KRV46643.1 hypothetical protein AQ490_12295 [Wenjunlia vitaminophila]
MTRPTGWEVVGESSDPVPGDPMQVAALGAKLRRTADAIVRQADELRAMASVESWKGKAADEFRDQAEKASDKLRKAFHRYDAAAKALGTRVEEAYAGEIHEAQRLADKALQDAKDHHAEYLSMVKALDHLPEGSSDDPAYRRITTKRDNAQEVLSEARDRVLAAKQHHEEAAKAAADAIRKAISHDGLKDGGWYKFKKWVHDNADLIKKIADIAGWVATVCGILSLCVGWIPLVGQALAGILGTIALIATLVALGAHLLLALAGEGSWLDVGLDVVALATFGIGRGALGGVRAASAATRASARSAAFGRGMSRVTGQAARRGTAANRRAVEASWRAANRQVPGAPRGVHAAEALARSPRGFFPGWSSIRSGLSPVEVTKESWQSVRGLSDLKNVPALFKGETWRGASVLVGDSGLLKEADDLARINPSLFADDAVRTHMDAIRRQTVVWGGNTLAATAVDIGDKAKVFDDLLGVKQPLTREVGAP